jgi:hypothetical protein
MDPVQLHPLLRSSLEPLEHDLAEVDAAIELVRGGAAVRVRLVGLASVDRVAGAAAARAQVAGVEFAVDRTGATPALTIGPRS